MPTSLYNFQYVPLTGRLPGKSFVSQTEQAINGLAQYVYENSTNYEAVKAIAQKAEEDSSSALEYSEEALDKAQTALETVGRAYIKTISAVDLDDYFDSELLLILSTESTNLPANITGYLTVMSSDTHDYCMQVYIGIDGSVYKRTATITNNTPTFGAWSETPITMSSLQTILADYAKANASNIGVNAQTDNSVAWGNAIGGGGIAEDERRLITGGTIYPLSQNVEQNTSNIATNTADIVQNTGGISANSKRITNIEKLLQGNLYDYQTDSTSAYTKSVPAGAMPYAGLEKVGGKTVVWNQLVNDSSASSSANGYTYTKTAQEITVVVNQPTANGYWAVTTLVGNGHKILLKLNENPATGISMQILGYSSYFVGGNKHAVIVPTSAGDTVNREVRLNFTLGSVADGTYTYKVTVVDLTLMFGIGNEPSTVAEFESMFPADYYEYNVGTLLSAGVTEIVSKDSNNATLQTIPIPAEVQALEGYGWSAGSVSNYIDFERKVFVQEVGSRAYTSGDESDSTVVTDMTTTYYPLTTAVETDISQYLTDDNLIQVESGGTLTFPNQNGTDYQIPVPSEETYMIDLQSAL